MTTLLTDPFRWIDQAQSVKGPAPRHLERGCWTVRHREHLRLATVEEMTHRICQHCANSMGVALVEPRPANLCPRCHLVRPCFCDG